MTDFWGMVIVYAIGLVLYFVELFVPSGGVIGAVATLLVGFSLWQIFPTHPYVGVICVLITIVYLVFLIRWGIRRINSLTDLAEVKATGSDVVGALALVGVEGTAVTPLRPAGVAMIRGRRLDVICRGGSFIEAGTRVQVLAADGNRIVVRPL